MKRLSCVVDFVVMADCSRATETGSWRRVFVAGGSNDSCFYLYVECESTKQMCEVTLKHDIIHFHDTTH